jgi:hypothetical protein
MKILNSHLPVGALLGLLLAADPFSLLAPAITISAADRRNLDRGAIVTRTLEGDEREVGVFAMSRINVPPETLIAQARAIEDLKRSSFVTAIQRFSNPPRLDDLDQLMLTARDVEAAARCTIGDCSFKLSAPEIELLRSWSTAGTPDRDAAIQRAFRQVVLARVKAYLAGGLAAVPAVANRSKPLHLDRVFQGIVSAGLPLSGAPGATEWLRDFPGGTANVESFLYWSQENYGAGKPVVAVTHLGLFAPDSAGDPAIVLGKQIFATRYMTGGLALTAVTTDTETGARYLVYLNRTGVDLLGGFFGPLKRSILESRLKSELPEIIQKLRVRLERP